MRVPVNKTVGQVVMVTIGVAGALWFLVGLMTLFTSEGEREARFEAAKAESDARVCVWTEGCDTEAANRTADDANDRLRTVEELNRARNVNTMIGIGVYASGTTCMIVAWSTFTRPKDGSDWTD